MRKQYFFLIALGFSSSSFALENLPLSHKGLEKLKMQEIGSVIKIFYQIQMYLQYGGITSLIIHL